MRQLNSLPEADSYPKNRGQAGDSASVSPTGEIEEVSND